VTTTSGSAIARAPRPSSLADVLDLILDKGLVIDAYVRVSAVGIELLTIDARIVVASVDTYLHYAEAVNRLDLRQTETQGLTGLFDGHDEGSSDGQGNGNGSSQRSSSGSSGRSGSGGRALSRGTGGGSGGSRRRSEGDSGDSEGSEGEGVGRSLARRLTEKGKWDS
jgi:gas vesicle structural protein